MRRNKEWAGTDCARIMKTAEISIRSKNIAAKACGALIKVSLKFKVKLQCDDEYLIATSP